MKKFLKCLQSYLVIGFPFVLILLAWGSQYVGAPDLSGSSVVVKALWEVLAWNLIAWLMSLILFFATLILRTRSGDQVLQSLTHLKERDEREAFILGRSAKSAFISTLALVIFLTLLSAIQVQISQLPPDQIKNDGHTKILTLGLNYSLFDPPTSSSSATSGVLFEKHDLPLSKFGILLLILTWHLGSFYIKSRKQFNEE